MNTRSNAVPHCIICNEFFTPRSTFSQVLCGKIECKRENKRRVRAKREGKPFNDLSPRTCVYCETVFKPNHPRQNTCPNPTCRQKGRNAAAAARYVAAKNPAAETCPICKRTYVPHYAGQKTCGGARCAAAMRKLNASTEVRKCKQCGDEFKATPGEKKEFCTKACKKEWTDAQDAAKRAAAVDCPFSWMTTRSNEYPRLDCPECDPMTNRMHNDGLWVDWVRRKHRKKEAA